MMPNKRMMVPYAKRGYLRTGGFYGRLGGETVRGRELKFLDAQTIGLISVNPVGNILISSHQVVVQGNGPNERIGRKITVRSLEVRGTIQTRSTIVLVEFEQRARIVFVLDKQANGAVGSIDEVLNFGAGTQLDSFRNLENASRYRILYDKTLDMNPQVTAGVASGPQSKNFMFKKKLNIPIEYDQSATDGSLSTQRSNNIFSFAFAENLNADVEISYTFRIRYSDAG